MSDHDNDRTPPGAAPAVPSWERDRPWVERRNVRTGETKTYLADGTKPEQAAGLPKHMMQCVTITQDCGACHLRQRALPLTPSLVRRGANTAPRRL